MLYPHLRAVWRDLTAAGGAFEMETVSACGHDVRIYKHAPKTLETFWRSAAQFADRPYLIFNDERFSYGETFEISEALAGRLTQMGIGRGDKIAIAMRNYPEWLMIYWAAMRIGAVIVGMNAWWTGTELGAALALTQPKIVFADFERLERLIGAPFQLVSVRTEGAPFGAIDWSTLSAPGAPRAPTPNISGDDDACIFFTSGTSGTSKAARLTHRNCLTNIYNVLFWGQAQALAQARASGAEPSPPGPSPVALLATPLFHVTANNCGAHIVTALGGSMVLMARWDAGEALRLIGLHGVTILSGVPLMARELITHPNFSTSNLSSLTSIGGGGAPMQPDLVSRIDQTPSALSPSTGYGMTEASGVIASISGAFFLANPTSCGPAMPSFDVKCIGEDGSQLPQGAVGELCVRGGSVICGFDDGAGGQIEAQTDGWLHTGDLARIDENGFIHIVDRKKDMVLRGGENVFCAEVEAVLYKYPGVGECCVFAIPDERLGETVGAAIAPLAGAILNEDALRAHCRDHIAAYKIPERIWFVTAPIPRNANGKFLKRQLREALLADASENVRPPAQA